MRVADMIVVLVLGSVTACGSPSTTPAPAPSPPSSRSATSASPVAAPVVEATVDGAGAVTLPRSLAPGGYVFRVTSAGRATVMVLELEAGYTQQRLLADLTPQTSEERSAAAAERIDTMTRSLGGADAAPRSPAQFAIRLDPGTYWFVALPSRTGEIASGTGDVGQDGAIPAGALVAVTVSGTPMATTLPTPDATAVARDDRSWALPAVLPARGTLLLRNPGANSHRLLLDPVPDGLTAQEWLDATRIGRGMEGGGVGTARLSAGAEMLWIYDLSRGDYVAMDSSIGENGYPQPHGARAVIVTLE
jgi:hypothetical protein